MYVRLGLFAIMAGSSSCRQGKVPGVKALFRV